jgi:hypothetical protein
MINAVELEARISALELVVLTHILQSGIADAAFDPMTFATSRRDAWSSISRAMCEGCTSEAEDREFTSAYGVALERLGHLLVTLAEPFEQAIDEIGSEPPPPSSAAVSAAGPPLQKSKPKPT